MFGRNQISDRDLLKAINQRLVRTGTASSSKVNVSVQQGNVTLTGTLQHAIQRGPIVKAISRVTGVRRVVDQMQHTAKKAQRPGDRQNARMPARPVLVESTAVPATEDKDKPADKPVGEPPRPE